MKVTFELDNDTLMKVYRGYCDVDTCEGCKYYDEDNNQCKDEKSKDILQDEVIELINERV